MYGIQSSFTDCSDRHVSGLCTHCYVFYGDSSFSFPDINRLNPNQTGGCGALHGLCSSCCNSKISCTFCLHVHFRSPKQRVATGLCHVDGLFPVKWKLNLYVFVSVSFGLEPGLVIPTVRDSFVRGSVSFSAEAFPEVPDELLQTQRRNCGRVSEYRPRRTRPPYKTVSRPYTSLNTTQQGCGTKWSIATANPGTTGTVFGAKIGLSATVYVQVHRCLLTL